MSKISPTSIMVVWIAIGAAAGIALHNLPLWLGACVVIGFVTSGIARRKTTGDGKNEPNE